MFTEVEFDLSTLYACLTSKTADLFRLYNTTDVSYKAQRAQIGAIMGLVDDLLFTTRNADDYFFGVFDNLSSLDKTDLDKTTEGSVDVAEGVAILPFSMPSAIRVPFNHLIKKKTGDIFVKTNDNQPAGGQNGAGTRFGFAFSDITSIWRYEAVTESQDGVQVGFTFPLRPDDEITRITRVELNVIAGNPVSVRVLGSLDNENYRRFVGSQDKVVREATEKIAFDFPDTPVRYIRVVLSKANPDAPFTRSQLAKTITSPAIVTAKSELATKGNSVNLASTSSSVGGQLLSSANSPNTKNKLDTASKAGASTNTKQLGIGTNTKEFLYNFNVSSIAVFRLGRNIDAIFQSKPLRPLDSPKIPIDRISLHVDDEIIPHTAIDYQIGLADENGEVSDFRGINPTNRSDSDLPKVLTFGQSTKDRVEFTGSYLSIPAADLITNKAIDFYPIRDNGDSEYEFGTAKLYRGGNLFSRTVNSREVVRSVSDNFVDFSDGGRTKQLYAFRDEVATVINRIVGDGSQFRTFLGLTKTIKNSPNPVRDPINDPPSGIDPEPSYAVGTVRHLRAVMDRVNQPITPSGGAISVNGSNIPIAGDWLGATSGVGSIGVPILDNGNPIDIIGTGPNAPVLKYIDDATNFEFVFREGVDYSIKRSDDDYFNLFPGWDPAPIHWRVVPVEPVSVLISAGSSFTGQFAGTGIVLITGSNLPPATLGNVTPSSNETLYISYTIDADITHRVVAVSYTSSEVELDGVIQISAGDTVLVSYRFVPDSIVRGSIRVTQSFGTENEGQVFIPGVDYTVDSRNGTITKLVGGSITSLISEVVYVDYSYKDQIDQTETFSIWAFVDSREPIRFDFNNLALKADAGESFIWTPIGGTGTARELRNSNSITLTRGWHYFTVKSVDPGRFNDAAINKVLKLRSIGGDYLFLRIDRGGKVFDTMTAYRAPMREVSFPFLKDAVLKSDHDKFAIKDSDNKIYINFGPGNTTELYMKRITSGGVIQEVTSEEFIFEGVRRLAPSITAKNQGSVVLRARLSRSNQSSGGVTPKLHSYNIRVNY